MIPEVVEGTPDHLTGNLLDLCVYGQFPEVLVIEAIYRYSMQCLEL